MALVVRAPGRKKMAARSSNSIDPLADFFGISELDVAFPTDLIANTVHHLNMRDALRFSRTCRGLRCVIAVSPELQLFRHQCLAALLRVRKSIGTVPAYSAASKTVNDDHIVWLLDAHTYC